MEDIEIASDALGAIVGTVKMNVTWCILAMIAGGTYCLHCRKCLNCADLTRIGMATRSHDDSRLCECGSYLDLVGMVCVGCNRLCCLGKCERELVTNYCCGLDKCWRCSLWFCQLPRCVANTGARRACATCPHPPDAVLRRRIFPTAGGGE